MNIRSLTKTDLSAPGAMSSPSALSALRRDAAFILNMLVVLVFAGFASLAVGSAVLDLVSLR